MQPITQKNILQSEKRNSKRKTEIIRHRFTHTDSSPGEKASIDAKIEGIGATAGEGPGADNGEKMGSGLASMTGR